MNPLERLIQNACDENTPLASVLRSALIVAFRLDFQDLKDWILHELEGYPNEGAVPKYRELHTTSQVLLNNKYTGQRFTFEFRCGNLTGSIIEFVKKPAQMRKGVCELTELSGNIHDMQEPWPSDLAHQYGTNGYLEHFECLRAWKFLPKAQVKGLLDIVRTRLLLFALELEKDFVWVGDKAPSEAMGSPVVHQNFFTNILGGQNHIHTGSHSKSVTIIKGNSAALREALLEHLPQKDVDSIVRIVEEENSLGESFWSRLKEAGVSMSTDVVTEIVTGFLKLFLGIP